MKLPLPPHARVRVALADAQHAPAFDLCALARFEREGMALEWTPEALARTEDAGANVAVRQAPSVPGVHRVGRPKLDGLPGFLADSLPDSWGRLLLDRQLRARGIAPRALTGLDRLALVGARGPGALTYRPEIPLTDKTEVVDLDDLAAASEAVLTGRDPELLDHLAHAGGSAGGSRPKAWITESAGGSIRSGTDPLRPGETGWLVKFRAPHHDPVDVGPLEFAYARMALAAGLEIAEPRLFEGQAGRYFASRRFDREGGHRVHVLTAAGLLDVAPSEALAADYVDLLKLTRHVTRSEVEVKAAYRHAVFNVLAHNRDDHLKQFAFRRRAGTWTRTPAYDLVFNEGPGGEHTLLVAGAARNPGPEDLSLLAERADLDTRVARKIVTEVRAAVARWPDFAAAARVSPATTREVAEHLPG